MKIEDLIGTLYLRTPYMKANITPPTRHPILIGGDSETKIYTDIPR